MKVGSICYATSRGLGHLCRDFYQHGVVTDVMVVRHSSVPTETSWYPKAKMLTNLRDPRQLEEAQRFCSAHEAMLFFETPFLWELFDHCKAAGVRTYLMTMYECTPKMSPRPHKYLCPSLLDLKYFPSGVFLPIPVEYPWRLRERAEHFVHNGGYLGLRGREGTDLLVEAIAYVKSPAKFTIRCQERLRPELERKLAKDKRVEYRPEQVPYHDLYATGDVCVAPQRFNGCSLPLQEARAAGLGVMCSNRFPMNTWLPLELLIPVTGYMKASIGGAYLEFDEAQIDPKDVAATIDKWYGQDLTAISKSGRVWAEEHSWSALKPKYLEVLSQ